MLARRCGETILMHRTCSRKSPAAEGVSKRQPRQLEGESNCAAPPGKALHSRPGGLANTGWAWGLLQLGKTFPWSRQTPALLTCGSELGGCDVLLVLGISWEEWGTLHLSRCDQRCPNPSLVSSCVPEECLTDLSLARSGSWPCWDGSLKFR